MRKAVKYLIPIACLAVGFFVGNIYARAKYFGVLNFPAKMSGLYGIDKPCPEDSTDPSVHLALLDFYGINGTTCVISSVEKDGGFFKLNTAFNCNSGNQTNNNSSAHEVQLPERFSLYVKPITENKVLVRIDDKPEQVFTRCHILRAEAEANSNN